MWQALGASQGDFERIVVAPFNSLDAFNTMPELFNLTDKLQCPGIVLTDLLISEGTSTVDPDLIDVYPTIDRGELITEGSTEQNYKRYESTESGVSPRALPGIQGHIHVVATDEHDENSLLISDEFTDPHKRRKMVEKRARKLSNVESQVAPPSLEGQTDAEVTLVGWGSTYNVIKDAIPILQQNGITVNHLPIKWIGPLHGKVIEEVFTASKRTIIVENNYSGQFARYLRSETGISADGHIRKYDGEPFAPHHIVEAVMEQLEGNTTISIPYQEIMV